MRILTFKNTFSTLAITMCTITCNLMAQDNKTTNKAKIRAITQWRKTNTLTVNDINIVAIGKNKKALIDCKQEFNQLDGTIIFNTPNYKVWIGNFRTRIEAEKFSSTKNSFSNAFNQAKKVIKIRFYLQKSLHSVASDFF
jgi:hypothetical protein